MRRILPAMVAPCILLMSGCASFISKTGVKSAEPYFHSPETELPALDKINDRVYSFRWKWYRNLILVTNAGLVVIDPMGTEAATALRASLNKELPGKSVDTLIYSHYHLDHTRGGAALSPGHVIAHKKCPRYWKDFDATDIAQPTQFIEGDQTLTIGDLKIEALDLGLSHTDTLYAFHIPSEQLVFTADLGLVKTVPPDGVPDHYTPGYMAAIARVAALDFKIFVPSHFGYGNKQDLVEYIEMIRYGQSLAKEAVQQYGGLGVQRGQFARYFDHMYNPMRKKYGQWHGFNAMFINNMFRDITGVVLGY